MHLKSLLLKNFRLYEEAVFSFSPQMNVICGPNARGKTTILEAIHCLMTGKSFRTAQTSDLIRKGASFFFIEGVFVKNGVEHRIKFSSDGKERRIYFNSTQCQSAINLLGLLQGVVMTPDDASLVKGAPAGRRQFLDLQIAQADPLYVHYATRYNRAMRQRNCLLKAKQSASIETWEQEMAAAAAYMTEHRSQAIKDLQFIGSPLHQTLSGNQEMLSLKYERSAPDAATAQLRDYFIHLFQKNRRRELDFGTTLYGPQKDDVGIYLNEQEARYFGSEGQQRCSVAALKLAEWVRLKDQCQEAPLMLIDDVGLSLDSGRKERLFDHLRGMEQVFLTATEDRVGELGEFHKIVVG